MTLARKGVKTTNIRRPLPSCLRPHSRVHDARAFLGRERSFCCAHGHGQAASPTHVAPPCLGPPWGPRLHFQQSSDPFSFHLSFTATLLHNAYVLFR